MVSLQIVAHYLECVYAEHMKVTAKTDKVDAFYIGSFTFFLFLNAVVAGLTASLAN